MNEVEEGRIGKSKVGLIVAVVVIIILAISSVWLYLRVDDLREQADSWELFADLLTAENEDLQDEVDDLTTENSQLEDEVDWLNYKYDNYIANHQYSNLEYEDIQFYFYYVETEQKFGVYELDDELYGWEWYVPYEENVFDCSEMSAYLEWYLENEGWNTIIVIGDAPFDTGYHAWLLVETSEGKYTPVESTTAEIVWWEDTNFDNYWIYDDTFETIQDALAYSETEFDWWM